MPRREDLKKVDITIGESLYEASRRVIANRSFSMKVRLAAKRLTDSFGDSPEVLTERVRRRLPDMTKAAQKQLTKRLSIEFSVEDLSKVDEVTEYLRKQGLDLARQDVIRFALLEWPNPD